MTYKTFLILLLLLVSFFWHFFCLLWGLYIFCLSLFLVLFLEFSLPVLSLKICFNTFLSLSHQQRLHDAFSEHVTSFTDFHSCFHIIETNEQDDSAISFYHAIHRKVSSPEKMTQSCSKKNPPSFSWESI